MEGERGKGGQRGGGAGGSERGGIGKERVESRAAAGGKDRWGQMDGVVGAPADDLVDKGMGRGGSEESREQGAGRKRAGG